MKALDWAHGERELLVTIVVVCTLWMIMFLATKKAVFPNQSDGFANRFVSVIHSSLALCLAFVMIDLQDPLKGIAGPNSKDQIQVLIISFSYFLYDTLCSIYLDPSDVSNILHHMATLSGFGVGVFTKRCATELIAALLLAESSSPFLHMRYLLKDIGLKGSTIAMLNDLVFAIIFFVCRILLGPGLVYYTLRSNSHVLCKTGATSLFLVSLFWFYKIVQIASSKLAGTKKAE